MSLIIILILIISFFAALVRSTLGFGESLIAVPLFLFFLPSEVAVPLSVLLSIVIALIIIIQDHGKIHYESAKWLIIYSVPGIPLGLILLIYGNENLIKISLGTLVIVYSLYSLSAGKGPRIRGHEKTWLFFCGFLSGVFGGAYGLNGPPLVVYGNLKRWSAPHFRATLQAYFLPASFLGAVGYFQQGLINGEVLHYFLFALIPTIPTVFLGRYLNHRLNNEGFFRYVYGGLILLSILLIINALST